TVVGRSHLYDLCWLLALPCPDTPDREPLGMTPVWRWKAHVLKLPARQRGLACLFLPADAAIERAREPRFALGRRCVRFPVEPDHVVVSHAFPSGLAGRRVQPRPDLLRELLRHRAGVGLGSRAGLRVASVRRSGAASSA